MYEAPEVRDLGSVEELTETKYNKIGASPDVSSQTNPDIIGSLVPRT